MGAVGGKSIGPEELRFAIEKFNSDLLIILRRHHDAIEAFLSDYSRWLEKRTEVIDSLLHLADVVEKHHRNVKVASLSGSSVSLVGGAACLAGLVCAPFTGGLSVALSVGGLLGSSAGTLTMTGAHIVEFGLKKDALRKACRLVEEDCQETLHLSSVIENCQRHEAEIQSFLQEINSAAVIKQEEKALSKIITNCELKERLLRIKSGNGSVDDYFIIMSLLYSENFELLKQLHRSKSLFVEPKIVENTIRTATSLRSSVTNIRKCALLLKNWRAGVGALSLRTASKASRFAKSALFGLSMAMDAYDISCTARNIISGEKSSDAKTLRDVVAELQNQKNDVSEYYRILLQTVY